MSLSLNKGIPVFFVICFLAMAVPYFTGLGDNLVFKQDYYAKRIMTIMSFPFFGWVAYILLKKKHLAVHRSIIIYGLIYAIVFIISIINGNKPSLIVTDAFIALLPIFFYMMVFYTNVNLESYTKNFRLFIFLSIVLVLLGIKLQFSYFTLVGIAFILFYVKWKPQNIILFALLPFLTYKSLIGKSAFLLLVFIVGYLFYSSKTISFKKKMYLLLIPAVVFVVVGITYWDEIKGTGTYKNFVYFLRHADFENLSFKDNSTSHRLYEASIVQENFNNGNIITKVFGRGFGSTIDLSNTNDLSVIRSNADPENVRNIHIGFFAVLSRYGILGVVIYIGFVLNMIRICFSTLKRENHYSITLGCLYVVILLVDSFISFPHMMSNFLFWFTVSIILYYRHLNKSKLMKE